MNTACLYLSPCSCIFINFHWKLWLHMFTQQQVDFMPICTAVNQRKHQTLRAMKCVFNLKLNVSQAVSAALCVWMQVHKHIDVCKDFKPSHVLNRLTCCNAPICIHLIYTCCSSLLSRLLSPSMSCFIHLQPYASPACLRPNHACCQRWPICLWIRYYSWCWCIHWEMDHFHFTSFCRWWWENMLQSSLTTISWRSQDLKDIVLLIWNIWDSLPVYQACYSKLPSHTVGVCFCF